MRERPESVPTARALVAAAAFAGLSTSIASVPNAAVVGAAPVTGSVTGTFATQSGFGPTADLVTLCKMTHIVATTASGEAVGVFHFAAKPAAGVLPYTIDRLPLDVPLTIAGNRNLAGLPSPIPRGFFHAYSIQRAHPDQYGSLVYRVTLTAAAPHAQHIDFVAAPIEVFPEPQTPPPSATPSPAPDASSTPS